MEILTHFRSIEELTKTLSREQELLSEMFEKRKLMKFPFGLALELVGGNETRLRRLVDYGVLVETGNTIEIESDYLYNNKYTKATCQRNIVFVANT